VVVATFTEKPVMNDTVDVKLVEERITVLQLLAIIRVDLSVHIPWIQML